jgi:hypothetical protein
LILFNCKKDKDEEILAPPTELIDDINNVTMPPIVITPPAPVEVEEAKVELTAESAAFTDGLAGLAASGEIPASVTAAAAQVEAVLSPAEMATLNEVTPEVIAAVAAGGDLTPALQAVVAKVQADPALNAYLPVFTFPKVNGVTIGARIATIEQISLIEVSDQCLNLGKSAYQNQLINLAAQKAVANRIITSAYQGEIDLLSSRETSCKNSVPSTVAAYRLLLDAQASGAYAYLAVAEAQLGHMYPILNGFITVQVLAAHKELTALETAMNEACIETTKARIKSAQDARDADLTVNTANYIKAVNELTAARNEALAACHNQGGAK